MAFLNVEDMYGSIETVVFPNTYNDCQNFIETGSIILVRGRADVPADNDAKIIAEEIKPLLESEDTEKEIILPKKQIADKLYIKVKDMAQLQKAVKILKSFSGNIPVIVKVEETGKIMKSGKDGSVAADEMLIEGLELLLGKENVVMKYK